MTSYFDLHLRSMSWKIGQCTELPFTIPDPAIQPKLARAELVEH